MNYGKENGRSNGRDNGKDNELDNRIDNKKDNARPIRADLLVTNIGQLLTLQGSKGPRRGRDAKDLGIIENSYLAAWEGKVVFAGPMENLASDVSLSTGAKIIDAMGRVVSPGFVDSHTHLVFDGWRYEEYSLRCGGVSYLGIAQKGGGIVNTVDATRNASFEHLVDRTLDFLNVMLSYGTTTLEAKSGYGLDRDTEIKQLEVLQRCQSIHPCSIVPTFLGAHAIPKEFKDNRPDYVELVKKVQKEVRDRRLALFADVFCDAGAFTLEETRDILEDAKSLGFGLKIHSDEIESIGATELAVKMGAVSCDHLVKITGEGIKALSQANTVAVLLPLTSAFLGKWPFAPGRALLDSGVACALGTDFNPGSCTAMSMPLAMTMACSAMGLSPEEAFTAATWNAAYSMGMGGRVGALLPGFSFDAILFDASDFREIPYRFGVNLVQCVIKKGKIVYGKEKCSELSP